MGLEKHQLICFAAQRTFRLYEAGGGVGVRGRFEGTRGRLQLDRSRLRMP